MEMVVAVCVFIFARAVSRSCECREVSVGYAYNASVIWAAGTQRGSYSVGLGWMGSWLDTSVLHVLMR